MNAMTLVLIVDDKQENLDYLQALLTCNGCTVQSAHDGEEALASARQSPPDIIISDLLMPVMDGFTLLRHWKADARLKQVPFIVYTATYGEPEDEQLARSLGADAFILKPAEPDVILAQLREVLTNAATVVPLLAKKPAADETVLLKSYSEALIRKLEEKTLQLEESNRALEQDIAARKRAEEVLTRHTAELEQFHRLSVGRELQMIELKKQVNEVAVAAGLRPPYELAFLGLDPVSTKPGDETIPDRPRGEPAPAPANAGRDVPDVAVGSGGASQEAPPGGRRMTLDPPIQDAQRGPSIRWKLAAAFIAVAAFVAAFVGVAIAIHFATLDRAAQLEAGHVAELIADGAIDRNGFKPGLQEYVSHVAAVRIRGVVIVDSNQKILADSNPEEAGLPFDQDAADEVGMTIRDGTIRTFVEATGHLPDGASHLVVPVRQGKSIVGAVIIEDSLIREELYAAAREEIQLFIATGIVLVLLVTLFGLGIARRIAQPLADLKSSAVRIATQDYAARVVVTSHDEIGLLGTAFNKMAEELGASHADMLEFNNRLDRKVSERTRELRDSALVSLNMMEDAVRQREDADQAHKKLDYLSYYDALTGLANRSLFVERVAQHMRSATSDGHRLALLLVDLERFKNINDSLGRLAGDELLKQMAKWLERNVGDASLLARVDADHFAVVLPEVGADSDIASFMDTMMTDLLEQPFRLNDAVFRIAAKAGVGVFPNDGDNADALYKHAEAALKQAKARGDRYLFYTQTMTDKEAGKPNLESQLRQALDNEEFVLHYQPKVDLTSGLLTGAEALIRWNDPRTGLVPPYQFIPTLEETGLIYEVGRWAMHKAIADYLRWLSAGLAAPRIAVNVSPLQVRNRGFIAEVERAIGIDAYAPAGLELEITESMVMEDIKQSIASLRAIRALGVSIAIDDFGTGFSSLGYLAKLPVDTLKIDRSFIVDMTTGPQGLSLVSTIITLAHSLNLKVVAEGVETEEQARLLRLLRCDQMQGYLFSKPLPGEMFETRFLLPASPPTGLTHAQT